MPATLKTSAAVVSSIGCVRKNNEDNFYFMGDTMNLKNINAGAHIAGNFNAATQMYAILDGMGGQNTGERACCIAAELLAKHADRIMQGDIPKGMMNFAEVATKTVYEDGIAQGLKNANQGTTLAVVCLKDHTMHIANVGDSRVYVLRQKELRLLSQDHSGVFALYASGKINERQMRNHPKNNIIDHYIGMDPAKIPPNYVYYTDAPLYRGDRIMLCSDGLTDLVPEARVLELLNDSASPDDAACRLVMAALELGGKDNTTCIVIDVQEETLSVPAPKPVSIMTRSGKPMIEETTAG